MILAEPNFIARDPQEITAQIVADYERIANKTLYPAQVERLFIDVLAYRETLVRVGIQQAAKQNLVAFAQAPMLDYLGELVGVTRLLAQPARCMLQFTLDVPQLSNLLIPTGTRTEVSGGIATFATDADVVLLAGQLTVSVAATCLEAGADGNGWQPGQVNNLVDDLGGADILVSNSQASAGGVDEELDDRLRERIKLAPEAFSTAGSRLAYRFHALRAHQSIVDVAVVSPIPGTVNLYPLLDTGLPDATILALVEATCSDERVRPLCDTVVVLPPVPVDFSLLAELTLYASSDNQAVRSQALTSAQAYTRELAAKLGRDIVPSQATGALQAPGVYQVKLPTLPFRELAEHEWARCSRVAVDFVGVVNG